MAEKISSPRSGHGSENFGGEKSTQTTALSWPSDIILYNRKSPYHGAYLAVVESVCKLVASGASFEDVYLTFQEYFERPNGEKSWGKPLSALLGALKAQTELGIAAIGGKGFHERNL